VMRHLGLLAAALLAASKAAPAVDLPRDEPTDWPPSYRPDSARTAKGRGTKKAASRRRPKWGAEAERALRRARVAWITARCFDGSPRVPPRTVAEAADRMTNWQRCRWFGHIAGLRSAEARTKARADLDLALRFVSLQHRPGWTE
jgi:hypothetical protein